MYLNESKTYFVQLKDHDDNLLFRGRRKRFIVGFLMSAMSAVAISKNLLNRENNPFLYFFEHTNSRKMHCKWSSAKYGFILGGTIIPMSWNSNMHLGHFIKERHRRSRNS